MTNSDEDSAESHRLELLLPNHLTRPKWTSNLSHFDYGRRTKLACTWGLTVVWLVIISCIIGGIFCLVYAPNSICMYRTTISPSGGEALSFVLNIIVTLCIEVVGYIHGTSLRWALFREGRLEFNTNIRLFEISITLPQHRRLANAVCIASLVLCYASSSQIFITATISGDSPTWINGVALLALALGLLIKATISTWILVSASKYILTWGSNPLNNTLAAVHHGLEHKPNLCMLSVHQAALSSVPIRPLQHQEHAKDSNSSISYILFFTWAWPCLILAAFVILVILSWKLYDDEVSIEPWQISSSQGPVNAQGDEGVLTNSVYLNMAPGYATNYPWPLTFIFGILFLCAVQGGQTINLHALELLVNIWRDELLCRSPSCQLETNSFLSSLKSPMNIVLFTAKTLLHWLLGQAFALQFQYGTQLNTAYGFQMMYLRILTYLILTITLASYSTFLAHRKLKGCKPASFRHLQTLADLIDNWELDEKDRFGWGDKGVCDDGVRHAGTSSDKGVVDVIQDAFYAGIG